MKPGGTLVAVLSLSVAASIHGVAAADHLRLWLPSGVFFVAAALAQSASAYGVLRGATRRNVRVTIGINVVLVAVWTLSRTIGMPFGPAAGVSESVGGLDAAATVAEILSIGILIGHRRSIGRSLATIPAISRTVAGALVATVVGLGTASAGAVPSHAHGAETHDLPHEH